MEFTTAQVVGTYILCGVIPLLLVPYILRQRHKPGTTGLLITIIGLTIWAAGMAGLQVTTAYWPRQVVMSVFLAGVIFGGVGYFFLAAEYSGVLEVRRRLIAIVLSPLVAMLALAWSDSAHGLVWSGAVPGNITVAMPGPAFFVYISYAMLVAVVGLFFIAREVAVGRGIRRLQGGLLLGAVLPLLVMGAIGSLLGSGFGHPWAPLGFALTIFFYVWALFRTDFLEVGWIGRHRVVEELDDAVVTIDLDDRVVYSNPAAREIAGVDDGASGYDMADFFEALPAVREHLAADGTDIEFSRELEGENRYYQLDASPVTRSERRVGRLVVMRDVTQLKRREEMLLEREHELDLLRQVLSRALRHNLRNDLSVIRGYAELVATDPTADEESLAKGIVERSDELVEMSKKASTIERIVTESEVTGVRRLDPLLSDIVSKHRSRFPGVSFELETETDPDVEVDASLALAFENLIENAAEHSTSTTPVGRPADGEARSPRPPVEEGASAPDDVRSESGSVGPSSLAHDGASNVTVRTAETDGGVTVIVSDDGPGIPRHELAVLEKGEETPLKHGSGIGLWIVYWIVDHVGASIDFETGDDGTTVSVTVTAETAASD